jgi:hypothetical protein
LDFYSASLLKQQSAGRHVAPLGHIILILRQHKMAGKKYHGEGKIGENHNICGKIA